MKIIKHTIQTVILLTALCSHAGISLYELGKPKEEPIFLPGKVSYARALVLAFDEAGTLDYVASQGTLLRGRITDASGKVLFPGDIIAAKDTTSLRAELQIARAKLHIAENTLAEKKENVERDSKLHKRGSVSAKNYLESKTAYENAMSELIRAKAEVTKQQNLLDRSILRSSYPCVISEIYRMPHVGVDTAQPIVKIVFPYAMKVTVNLPRGLSRYIDPRVRAMIYPEDESTPVPSWFQRDSITPTTLECYVYNPDIPVELPGEHKSTLPHVGKLSFVFKRPDDVHRVSSLWIPPDAIVEKDGRQYVWKVKNIKAFSLTGNVPQEFELEKIAVHPLDRFVDQGSFRVQALAENSGLSANDIVVSDVPANFTGGNVCIREMRKRFNDGDIVNVRLTGLPLRGIYNLPRSAVRLNAKTGAMEVLMLQDRKFIAVALKLAGLIGETVPVYSGNLPAGTLIAAEADDVPESASDTSKPEIIPWQPLPPHVSK